MKVNVSFDQSDFNKADLKVVAAYTNKNADGIQHTLSSKEIMDEMKALKISKNFIAKEGTQLLFNLSDGSSVLAIGMGKKTTAKAEQIRRSIANAYKAIKGELYNSVAFDMASFNAVNKLDITTALAKEALILTAYDFNKYQAKQNKNSFKAITLFVNDKKVKRSLEKKLVEAQNLAESVCYTRDLVNEAPNVLHSEEYAKRIEKDVKANLKGVKVKIMGKPELKKENMNLFLSVNAGSNYGPRLVHLTYTPKKVTKNTKHIAMVGKGLTFDTGGYSLKPGASMMGMKFDMGGSATVYGAFRAAVLNNSPYKITLILGMTDNAVNEKATMPDSVVKGRNGTTVEILNTDAEGRLVLADCLDYACDQGPDYIIDAATLTGACLVALGSEVCAVLGNDQKWIDSIKKSAKDQDEYMWQLPIIDEWRGQMKSHIADLRNIGTKKFAGTATAAAFLENFIKNDVKWAHLDIAGVCDSQSHLPYCPEKGGSGLIVRTLANLLS